MTSKARADRTALHRYRFGTAEFDEARFELRVAQQQVEMQRRPLEVLALLLHHAGEVVTREELQEAVWNNRPTVENVIDTALTKLRGALGPENAARIVTQPRVGYRLVGPVERVAVGRHFSSVLALSEGDAVERRENFVLVSRLGQSAHHEVWLARHAKTDEPRVYKFSVDGDGLAALKREATLARVLRESLGERSDFVRVLDWNFDSPPFFLECEYGGANLLGWASERLAGLAMEERVRLMVAIAEAVAAAHSVGVLHKDLKPANLLVSENADGCRVRVTDFGSARLLEPERLQALGITQLGLTVTQGVMSDAAAATPLYVAPERLLGAAATVQSDVFALGILLYQLVVGDLRKPLVSGWEREVPDELLREDIAAATDGNPAHRLSSAAALAERLRRLKVRAAERAAARAAERAAQEAKEVLNRGRARRPWIIAAFCCLVLGLALSVLFYWRASIERARAERASARSTAINRFLNDDLLRAGDPTAPGSIADPRLRDILARAAERLRSELAQAPLIRTSIYLTLGQTYTGLGDYANAEQQLRRAIEAAPDNPEGQSLRAHAEYTLAQVMLLVSKFPEAKELLDQADRDAATQLSRPTPLAVTAHLVRGRYEDDLAREPAALVQFQTADHIRQLSAPNDVVLLFETRRELIDAYISARRFGDAKGAAEPLLAREFSADRVGIGNWARVRESFGEVLSHEQSYSSALALDQGVVGALSARLGKTHYYVAVALSELGNVYVDAGKPRFALAPMRQAYDILRTALGADSQDTLGARANVAVLEAETGDSKAAIVDLTECRDQLVKLLGQDNPEVEFFDYYLALSLSDTGRQPEAWNIASKLSDATLASAGEGGEDWSERLQALKGRILLREGQKSNALGLLAPAVARMEGDRLPEWVLDPFVAALDEARR